ncbi:MAG TPA: 16S rRNA (guanine(966)-N(2))-methyltransferase RsmD [Rhizomicrobium sp.]|jgi:16S rRNA (guanine966-N2)-methyltransferase|nr:16S rRNA (guanine(966)-N(2))-methyltransferase RsmD [Rhizomicrobium sp.]
MRITGGKFGGRVLAAPDDNRVRPTAGKTRQAIFNILEHNFGAVLENTHVIDLFAGTGALGLEAISHGAEFCLFVDDAAESRALIRRNVEALGLTGATKIWRRDATNLGPPSPGAGGPFGLAFLDPPYHEGLVEPALAALHEGWLKPQAIVVVETASGEDFGENKNFAHLDERNYGDTRISILEYRDA